MSQQEKKGWFARLKSGLSRSSDKIGGGLSDLLTKRKLDEDSLQDLEDLLISADLGIAAAARLRAQIAKRRFESDIEPDALRHALAQDIADILTPIAQPLERRQGQSPQVILMVGVNGTGKTTTIGKLATRFRAEGHKVMLAAGDTFRAAAIEQLQIWGERTGCPVVAKASGADAAGLAYDALAQAQRDGVDLLLIDTAGRLHNKSDLMAELDKIIRVIRKLDPDAPHDILLTLDATTGQNALSQVGTFRDLVNLTGLILTKLDGSAKGGVLVALAEQYGLPVHAIGIGEGADDLRSFDPDDFARALVGLNQG